MRALSLIMAALFFPLRLKKWSGRRGTRKPGPPMTPPPIGALPRFLWEEVHPNPSISDLKSRLSDIDGARFRRLDAGLPPVQAWEDEAAEILGRLVLSDADLECVSAGKAETIKAIKLAGGLISKPLPSRTTFTPRVASDATPKAFTKGTCEGGVCR